MESNGPFDFANLVRVTSDADVGALAVDTLGVFVADLDDDTLAVLASRVPELHHLIGGTCRVTDAGLRHVTRFTRLESLDLEWSSVTDNGLANIAAIPTLRWVDIGFCAGVTLGGVAWLRRIRPDLEVVHVAVHPHEADVTNHEGLSMRLDPSAVSAAEDMPAFLTRPKGAPPYFGFPLIEATRIDGWCLGVITEFEDPSGCTEGDAFVEAPDGTRAGLVWDVSGESATTISPPDTERWGVYGVSFPAPIRTVEDLAAAFRSVLPVLQDFYAKARPNAV